MELTGGFSVKEWSRFHIPRCSDCSGKWWWWGQQKNSGSSEWGLTLLVAGQPEVLWSNGVDRQIQRERVV